MGKLSATIIVTIIWLLIGLYTAYVAMCYFNWFVTRALHADNISYLEMLGIVWLFNLFRSRQQIKEEQNRSFVIDYDEFPNKFWGTCITMVIERIANNTLILAVGFGLHLLVKAVN